MTLLVPFFFAHQPFRLQPADARDRGAAIPPDGLEDAYFDAALDQQIFLQVTETCYRPATRLISDLVRRHAGREKPFRLAYGLSGSLLRQAGRWAPDLLDLWKELADTGCVEFTGETYYHSLASLFDEDSPEFRDQVTMHRDAIQTLFGQQPAVFRNTEMLYNDAIAGHVQDMGFAGMMTEGVDWLMAGWRSPNYAYRSATGLPVLLRNYRLSDDIAYRFSDRSWEGYPLTAETYAGWLAGSAEPVVLLALDYETLGEHVGLETGIFNFLTALPEQTAHYPHLEWATPSQAVSELAASSEIDVPPYATISWADQERDTSAWLGNKLQQRCFEKLRRIEPIIRATGDPEFLDSWRKMQASDHLRAMSSKAYPDAPTSDAAADAFARLHAAVYDLKRRAARFA